MKIEERAHGFAALGDPTRLRLVSRLMDRQPHSISNLTEGNRISRQAVTKHLTVLENVNLVSRTRDGRESLYELNPEPLRSLQEYLEIIASQWDEALKNLKALVEE